MSYSFRSMAADDLGLVRGWIATPEVARWWDDPDELEAALAAPAVAQRDRDRALGVVLADDMRVESGYYGFWGKGVVHVSCGRSHS